MESSRRPRPIKASSGHDVPDTSRVESLATSSTSLFLTDRQARIRSMHLFQGCRRVYKGTACKGNSAPEDNRRARQTRIPACRCPQVHPRPRRESPYSAGRKKALPTGIHPFLGRRARHSFRRQVRGIRSETLPGHLRQVCTVFCAKLAESNRQHWEPLDKRKNPTVAVRHLKVGESRSAASRPRNNQAIRSTGAR